MTTFTANTYPTRATVFPLTDNLVSGVTLAVSVLATPPGGYIQNSTPGNGDTRTTSFTAAAGSYTLSVYYNKGSNAGIFDLYVDDVIVLTGIDTYSAGTVASNLTSGSVNITSTGGHEIKLVVNGKNASSSNYVIQTGLMFLKPTADSVVTTTVNIDESLLPTRAVRTHDEATVVTGNAIAFTADTSQYLNGYWMQSASANGDVFTQSVWLKAGYYFLVAVGIADNTCAKIDWTLDGATIASGQDWYSAGVTRSVIKTSSGYTVSVSGYHVLKGTINGRNASNVTAYNMKLGAYGFRQAVD